MNFGLMLIAASLTLAILSTVFVVIKAKKEEYPLRRRGLVLVSGFISVLFFIGILLLLT